MFILYDSIFYDNLEQGLGWRLELIGLDFRWQELEEALLTDGAEDTGSSLIQELMVRLLNGCNGAVGDVTTSNYQMYLRRLFRQKCHEEKRRNPFDSDVDFCFLPLRTKVRPVPPS